VALRCVDPPSKESYRLPINQETEGKRSVLRMAYAPQGATRIEEEEEEEREEELHLESFT
jgi:hypothetical protein